MGALGERSLPAHALERGATELHSGSADDFGAAGAAATSAAEGPPAKPNVGWLNGLPGFGLGLKFRPAERSP